MKRLVPAFAVMIAFASGAGAAAGAVVATRAVSWPAGCTTDACVNNHLNDLNTRVRSLNRKAFTRRVVVTEDYVFDDPASLDHIEMMVPCGVPGTAGFRGWAISGGVSIGGANADQWQVSTSGPPNVMNSWHVVAHNPEYVEGDPQPTVTTFVVCLR